MTTGFGRMDLVVRTPLAEPEARRAIESAVLGEWRGARAGSNGPWVAYRTGSAAELRLVGVYSTRGARRFPLLIQTLWAVDEEGPLVRLVVDGEEGPYLFYPKRGRRLWAANVQGLTDLIAYYLDPTRA